MKTCEEMAENVLRRRNEFVAKRKKQRTALISSCACLAVIAGIGFGVSGRDTQLPVSPDVTQIDTDSQYVNMDNIRVNYVGSAGEGKSKIDGILTDMDIQNDALIEDSLSLKALNQHFTEFLGISYEEYIAKLPEGLELDALYELKTRNSPNDNDYSLHDYVFTFKHRSGGEVRLALSPYGKPLRDWFILYDAPLTSEICGKELVITSHGSVLLTVFEHNGVWYDIEADGISVEDFVILICAVIS